MYIVLTILLIIVSLFILAIVLVQNPKGGGALGSAFGSATSNIIGVQRAGDTLERLTWGAAIILLVLSVSSTFFLPKTSVSNKSIIESTKLNTQPVAPQQSTAPAMTLPSPEQAAPVATPETAPAQ
ncbi:MAG: preprotein translocase subunit SecG [Chitinophagales bacterium]|nr:preprotein translocase subunit SecG [Chitinophagales bacterium]